MPESKKKVLIVDDDQFLLSMYSTKFNKSGFDADTAVGGSEALTKLREGAKPDIILLDLVMPAMDGLELLAVIRKEKLAPEAMVVILSNQNQPADVEKAKSLGIASYITKANSIPSEIVAEVIKLVEKKG